MMSGKKTSSTSSSASQGEDRSVRVGKIKNNVWENMTDREEDNTKGNFETKRLDIGHIKKWENAKEECFESVNVLKTEGVRMRNKEKKEIWENISSEEQKNIRDERSVKRLSKEQISHWEASGNKIEEPDGEGNQKVKRRSKLQYDKWETGIPFQESGDDETGCTVWKNSNVSSQVKKEITKFQDGTISPCDSREVTPPRHVRRSSSGAIKKTLAAFEQGMLDKQEPVDTTPSPGLKHSRSGVVKKGIAAFADASDQDTHVSAPPPPLRHSGSGLIKLGLSVFEGQPSLESPTEPESSFLEKRRSFHDLHSERFSSLMERSEQTQSSVQSVSIKIPVELMQMQHKRPQSLSFYPSAPKPEPGNAMKIPWGKEPPKRQTPTSSTKMIYGKNQFEASLSPESAEKKRREIAAFFQQSSAQISHKLELAKGVKDGHNTAKETTRVTDKTVIREMSVAREKSVLPDDINDSWEELLSGTELNTSIDEAFTEALLNDIELIEEDNSPGSEHRRRTCSENRLEASDTEMTKMTMGAKVTRSQTFKDYVDLMVTSESIQSPHSSVDSQDASPSHCLDQAVDNLSESTSEGLNEQKLPSRGQSRGDVTPAEDGDDSSSEGSIGMCHNFVNNTNFGYDLHEYPFPADHFIPSSYPPSFFNEKPYFPQNDHDYNLNLSRYLNQISFTVHFESNLKRFQNNTESNSHEFYSKSNPGLEDQESFLRKHEQFCSFETRKTDDSYYTEQFLIPEITITDLDEGFPQEIAETVPPSDGDEGHFLTVSAHHSNISISKKQSYIMENFLKGNGGMEVYKKKQPPEKQRKEAGKNLPTAKLHEHFQEAAWGKPTSFNGAYNCNSFCQHSLSATENFMDTNANIANEDSDVELTLTDMDGKTWNIVYDLKTDSEFNDPIPNSSKDSEKSIDHANSSTSFLFSQASFERQRTYIHHLRVQPQCSSSSVMSSLPVGTSYFVTSTELLPDVDSSPLISMDRLSCIPELTLSFSPSTHNSSSPCVHIRPTGNWPLLNSISHTTSLLSTLGVHSDTFQNLDSPSNCIYNSSDGLQYDTENLEYSKDAFVTEDECLMLSDSESVSSNSDTIITVLERSGYSTTSLDGSKFEVIEKNADFSDQGNITERSGINDENCMSRSDIYDNLHCLERNHNNDRSGDNFSFETEYAEKRHEYMGSNFDEGSYVSATLNGISNVALGEELEQLEHSKERSEVMSREWSAETGYEVLIINHQQYQDELMFITCMALSAYALLVFYS